MLENLEAMYQASDSSFSALSGNFFLFHLVIKMNLKGTINGSDTVSESEDSTSIEEKA